MSLKQDLHNRLWNAYQRWHEIRATGVTKRDLKLRGLREAGDPNRHLRSLIFTGNTLRSYESVLKRFVEMAEREFGARKLGEIGRREFRAFMDRSIERGLAAKTLNRYRSALAKFGALTGRTASFASLSERYGWRIRSLVRTGRIAGPSRATPSREAVERAISILRSWDERHMARTGEPRAYHLVARLQLETSARSISVTERFSADSLKGDGQVTLVAKGGKVLSFRISPELNQSIKEYLAAHPGRLADRRGYQTAYARAMRAAGGRITGTHGLRRLSAQAFYEREYRSAVGSGLTPRRAASMAAGNTLERLGHSRSRTDHRSWYLGR